MVISTEHAGLRPHFKALENELYRVLAKVEDPREVMDYLKVLKLRSEAWAMAFVDRHARK